MKVLPPIKNIELYDGYQEFETCFECGYITERCLCLKCRQCGERVEECECENFIYPEEIG